MVADSPFLEVVFSKARAKRCHIVLPEGEDQRIIQAAILAAEQGIADITLLGSSERIHSKMTDSKPSLSNILIVDPASSPLVGGYIDELIRIRSDKGITEEEARSTIIQPLGFAAMMVKLSHADGTIGGAVNTTADTLRAALQIIGRSPNVDTVSSFFIMIADKPHHPLQGPVIFADCAMVIDPTALQLAQIGETAALSASSILEIEPKVAFLSFSTAGSGSHEKVTRIREAIKIAKANHSDWIIEEELQFDAALDPALRERKAPGLNLDATPNVFVFPSLEAGNIGYKIAERVGGMKAVGPVLQGLAKPANDLSRGSKVEDILSLIAITVLQTS